MAKPQLFLGRISENAPPKIFNKVDIFLVKIQIKFELGNKKVPEPVIAQKLSYRCHSLIKRDYFDL